MQQLFGGCNLFKMWIALLALGAAGCGSSSATVSGAVSLNGAPIQSGSVILYCADKQILRGVIVDGHYSIPNVPYGAAIATVQTHSRVPVGLRVHHTVPPVHDGPVGMPTPMSDAVVNIPQRYGLPEESGLNLTVDTKLVNFEINLNP